MHGAGDVVMFLGDFDGHVGRHIDGFDGVHGEYGVGRRNFDGQILLEFCLEKKLCVSNTCFRRGKQEGDIQNGENEKGIY